MGQPTVLEDFVTDLTYRGTLREVWAVEAPRPGFNPLSLSRFTVYSDDLQTGRRSFNAGFTEPVFGIAEIPATHEHGGSVYVLTPDATTQAGFDPRIGIMDDQGNLLQDGEFTRIIDPRTNAAPPGFFTAMDVNPGEAEIAILDDGRATAGGGAKIVFLNTNYQVTLGPYPVEGLSSFFGSGIAYTGNSTVMVISQFRSSFEAFLALEYDKQTGLYTGRSLRMDYVPSLAPPITVGIDTGFSSGNAAIFFYNVTTDAMYALSLDDFAFTGAPGPVQDLSPYCALDASGRVVLTWNNLPAYLYDSIVVIENGVEVAMLDRTATQYVSNTPASGKYEYCLETRVGGSANPLRVCCEGESAGLLPFLPPDQLPASRVDIDPLPTNPHFQMGIACPRQVKKKEDFRMYVIGSYDNQVRVVDYQRQLLQLETIATNPVRTSVVQGNSIRDLAATGIALIDVEMEGQKVPMYVLLDYDGPNANFTPQASVHFLKDTTLPSNPGNVIRAGTRFQDAMDIDLGAQPGKLIRAWDADAANDLIALDTEIRTIVRVHYDPVANTMRAISDAPLPLADLTPFTGKLFPMGGISVLPNGNYLVAGGDTFDTTVTRVFLLTPFVGPDPEHPDPARSVKLVGYQEGLLTFSELFNFDIFGREVGPDLGFGLDTVFFSEEGTGGKGVGALFYNLYHYFPTDLRGFTGNFLINLASELSHPDLLAEPLADLETTVAGRSTFESDPLTPTFSNAVPRIDFHYHVFNPSLALELRVKIDVLLDGAPAPELSEQVLLPAGRSLYRRAVGRSEKALHLRIQNLDLAGRPIRFLAGATTIKPPPTTDPVFRRGDADHSGELDLTDAIFTLGYMFLAGDKPSCLDAADVDDSGEIDLSDPIYLLSRLFQGGPAIPAPGPDPCGPDPTADGLEPCVYTKC